MQFFSKQTNTQIRLRKYISYLSQSRNTVLFLLYVPKGFTPFQAYMYMQGDSDQKIVDFLPVLFIFKTQILW